MQVQKNSCDCKHDGHLKMDLNVTQIKANFTSFSPAVKK